MNHRNIMRIDLPALARRRLEPLSDTHGMTQVAMISRLVEWYSKQSPDIQSEIVRQSAGQGAQNTARKIIAQMAGE